MLSELIFNYPLTSGMPMTWTNLYLVSDFGLFLWLGGIGENISNESDDFYEFTPEDYYRLMNTKKEGNISLCM